VDHSLLDPRLRALDPDTYARIFLEYARAMRAVDPTIKISAIVDFNYGLTTYRPYPEWTERVLEIAGPEIDVLSVHNGFAPALGEDAGWNARTVYASMLAAPVLIRQSLNHLAGRIEHITGNDSKISIAVSEWGPYFAQNPQSRYVDHLKTLGSGIYTASVLAALVESPRTDVANGFKLVDQMTSGWIGIRGSEYVPKAPYYAAQLFTQHFGSILLETRTNVAGYESRSLGWVDAVPYVPYLDVLSSRGEDGRLYLMAINKHFDRSVEAENHPSELLSFGYRARMDSQRHGTRCEHRYRSDQFG
jgi:alpha-N-arabinofuranosidase